MKKLTYFAFAIMLIGLLACKNKSAQQTDKEQENTAMQDPLRPAGMEGLEGEGLTNDAPSPQIKKTETRKRGNAGKEAKKKSLKERVKAADEKEKKGKGGGEPTAQLEQDSDAAVVENTGTRAIQTSLKILDEEKKSSGNPTQKVAEQQPDEEEQTETSPPDAVTHAAWDALLKKYVSASGKVNYQGFQKEERKLDAYLETLKNNPPQSNWSRHEKLAYWINVYNAFTVKLIVKNHPVESITSLHSGKPWDVKWIDIDSKTYTLNEVEHDIIRPRFDEPRIHFAVNCAAQSCPPLLNAAYTADKLNTQLEQQTKKFINNSKYNSISAGSVEVSKIFDWYKEDFNNLIAFLDKYTQTDIDSDAKVSYKNYDWTLNN